MLSITRRRLLSAVALVLAMAALAGGWLWSLEEREGVRAGLTVYDDPRPLPSITLKDKQGRDWTPETLRKHWSVLTFGCVDCHHEASRTLKKLDEAVRHMERRGRFPPRPVFVTHAPGADTPERLRRHLDAFNPWFQGLTGRKDAVRALQAATAAQDHPGDLFVIDPKSRVVARVSGSVSGKGLARSLAAAMRRISERGA